MDPSCAVTGRGTLEELATQSPVAAVVCRPLIRLLSTLVCIVEEAMGVSRTNWGN